MTTPAAAGPLTEATLLVSDAATVARAYAALGLSVLARESISPTQAQAWGQPQLAGCASCQLAGASGARLLRLIEVPGASPRATRFGHGWLALEILVRDVDALWAPAQAAGFEILGPPADLDISPHIRAMQVLGPVGEMLYLTQVKAPVPPFDLPLSSDIAPQHNVDRLFIAVLSTPSRAQTLTRCAPLTPLSSLQFETRVTVLNRALGRPLEQRWPLATVQWAGQSLFEIDEVNDAKVQTPRPGVLPEGLAWITLQAPVAQPLLQEISPGAWLETVGVGAG